MTWESKESCQSTLRYVNGAIIAIAFIIALAIELQLLKVVYDGAMEARMELERSADLPSEGDSAKLQEQKVEARMDEARLD